MVQRPGVVFSEARFQDEYKLGAKLGEGHFGVVREVTSKASGKKYACKVLLKGRTTSLATSAETGQSERASRRLQWEAELSHELSQDCTGLVRTVQAFEDEQRVYLVMELCRGGTLADYIERRRDAWAWEMERAREAGVRFPQIEEAKRKRREQVETEAGWILGQLAASLAHCHEHGVIHRDLKPENVMLSEAMEDRHWVSGLPATVLVENPAPAAKHRSIKLWKRMIQAVKGLKVEPEAAAKPSSEPSLQLPNQVKIADFGLAERITSGGSAQQGLVGSPAYVAPEVVLSQPVGFAADVWGLGVILYFLLSEGRLPFSGRSTALLLRSIRKGAIDLSSPALVGASSAAKEVLQQLLLPDPESRPSAAEVLEMPWVREQLRRREAMAKMPLY